jgi:hypothetical protein
VPGDQFPGSGLVVDGSGQVADAADSLTPTSAQAGALIIPRQISVATPATRLALAWPPSVPSVLQRHLRKWVRGRGSRRPSTSMSIFSL